MITIFGAPGAGKSEQGRLLMDKYGWEWVSYRELLIRMRDKDILYAVKHGLFIDDAKATKLMGEVLAKLPEDAILDGFPADYRQLKWLIQNKSLGSLTGAIVLRVPRGELWRRLVARKRVDDTRAVIERRQDSYERNVTGMMRALGMNGIPVREVDGGNAPEDVLARIEGVLADWGLIEGKKFEKIESKYEGRV